MAIAAHPERLLSGVSSLGSECFAVARAKFSSELRGLATCVTCDHLSPL